MRIKVRQGILLAIAVMIAVSFTVSSVSAIGTIDPFKQGCFGAKILPSDGKPGTLTVKSVPSSASVYIDGAYMGITPLSVKIYGKHMVKVTKTGYKDYQATVFLSGANSKVSLTARLIKI
jgi:hypothetical protein